METLTIKFEGTNPLLMHSDKLSNPISDEAKAMKALTSKRKKTDEDHEEIALLEWKAGLYYEPDLGPYIPGWNARQSIWEAAKLSKCGKDVERGVQVLTEMCPLQYDGPRDLKKLWAAKKFADVRAVVVQRARTMRCRPIFRNWSFETSFLVDTEVIDQDNVLRFAETAGRLIGIGDFRKMFGRFDAKRVAGKAVKAA
jgi:hypothetical protein